MKEQIEQYIQEHGLKKNNRKHIFTYRRFYLYNKLREHGYTIEAIGKMFNRHHASVLHGIITHKNLTATNDPYYIKLTETERALFGKTKKITSLSMEVMDCYDIKALNLIKNRIRLGMYENL